MVLLLLLLVLLLLLLLLDFDRVVFVVLFVVVDEYCGDLLLGDSARGCEVPLMTTPSRGRIPIVVCCRWTRQLRMLLVVIHVVILF